MLVDAITEDCWDISKTSIELPTELQDRILSTPTPSIKRNDLLIPSFVTNKGFSLASAYKAQLPCADPQGDISWVWKARMEPKLKVFFWLMWHDRLPHRNLLTIRKIIHVPTCLRCLEIPEDSPHVIRMCTESKAIWLMTPALSLPSMPFRSWLQLNLESAICFKGVEWGILFPYMCHEIWKDRNDQIFRTATALVPNVLISKALVNARKFLYAMPNISVTISHNVNHSGGTHPSPCLSMQVDASFVSNLITSGLGG